MESVLLLNASFEPLRVISWRKAVCLYFSGKVEIVEEYERTIRSVSLVIKAPSIVRLLGYVKISNRTPPLNRVNILARDRFQCQYCSVPLTSKDATIDHVLPRSRGGATSWKNVVCCCNRCNRKKGRRTPEEAHMPLLKQPVQPNWLPVITVTLNGRVPGSWHNFLAVSNKL